jgi:hypothetical protein
MPGARILLIVTAGLDFGAAVGLLFLPTGTAALTGIGGVETPTLPLQLLGALLFGFAALNWLGRESTAGGVEARPLVVANLVFYLVAAMVLVRPLFFVARPTLWVTCALTAVLAACFVRLLFRPR